MTFVKRKEVNLGLRGSLWDQLLTFDVNYFAGKMDGDLARVNSFIRSISPRWVILPLPSSPL